MDSKIGVSDDDAREDEATCPDTAPRKIEIALGVQMSGGELALSMLVHVLNAIRYLEEEIWG